MLKHIATLLNDSSKESEFRILNMLIDILSQTMIDIFATATANFGVKEKYRPTIAMKNELTQWLL